MTNKKDCCCLVQVIAPSVVGPGVDWIVVPVVPAGVVVIVFINNDAEPVVVRGFFFLLLLVVEVERLWRLESSSEDE